MRAYRTVSDDVALVLAGVVPMDLMAREKASMYESRVSGFLAAEADSRARKIRGNISRLRQERWMSGTRKTAEKDSTGYREVAGFRRETANLLPHDPSPLRSRCFRSYLHKRKRADSPFCL